jgi:hypothetical protein
MYFITSIADRIFDFSMSDISEGWKRVLDAFEEWIHYESTEFAPWTGYFSLETLRNLTDNERIGWLRSMVYEIIPGRVDSCRHAGVALEDFLPYMPHEEAIETVQSMITLNGVIQGLILGMSDTISIMIEEYQSQGIDGIISHLSTLAETEEEIRHHMSLYSKGFAKLRSLGLEMPDSLE